jgi:hypothetical protein
MLHVHVQHKTISQSRSLIAADFAKEFLASELSIDDYRHHFDSVSYSVCKAARSEDDAYHRFRKESLNERLPGQEHEAQNLFRVGDPFYVESCEDRHRECTFQNAERSGNDIRDSLGLNLLQTCSQIYQEAKAFPFEYITFGFDNLLSLFGFLSRLTLLQRSRVRSLYMLWSIIATSELSYVTPWIQAIWCNSCTRTP